MNLSFFCFLIFHFFLIFHIYVLNVKMLLISYNFFTLSNLFLYLNKKYYDLFLFNNYNQVIQFNYNSFNFRIFENELYIFTFFLNNKISFSVLFIVSYFFYKFFRKILKIFINILNNFRKIYKYYVYSKYELLYQLWYKVARNQKNTYLALRFKIIYLNKKNIQKEILNDRINVEDIQEYFVLKRKNFFDTHLKPTKVRKYTPLSNLRRKFFSLQRRKNSLKGILFFYLKDYENRINIKEQQQKTLRIYEGLYGTFIYQELLKPEDQKQAKFVSMKLNRS